MNPLLYVLAWLLSWLPDRAFQYLCWRYQGHHFTATVLTDEGGFFMIDPTVCCHRCGASMSDDVYETVTNAYALAQAAELEDEVF